jgi:hypothetical protein
MADVSIYVPVISASAAILGAAVSPVSTVYQQARQARFARREQHATEVRQECIQLLRAVLDLRARVENNCDYHGDQMAARLAGVRQNAADAGVHATSIALLAPRKLANSASELAAAGVRLAASAAKNTDLKLGACVGPPDFGELDGCIMNFRDEAVAVYARG